MQPQQPSPTPQGQYDFILNPTPAPKRSLLGGSNSTAMRALVVVGGLFILATIAVVVMNFLGSAGSSFNKGAMLSVVQDQVEIARLAETGSQQGVSASVKNFAITTKLGVSSDQQELLTYLGTAGYKVSAKQLPLKFDAKADAQLADAKSSSNFDSAYRDIMRTKLQTYQSDLKAAYEGAGPKAKAILNDDFEHANLVLSLLGTNN